jgi:hypothetical protein
MVYGRVFEGSATEIANQIAQVAGNRRVSVLLMEDVTSTGSRVSVEEFEKVMEEIRAEAARVGHVDDSREALYTRLEGE